MYKRRKRPLLGWIILVVMALFIAGLVAFFVHLGSEQPQSMVEQPVPLPAAPTGTE